ncbi:MAG: O-antigen ligase family protein [Patescibacteria group bacterium]
MKISEWGIYLIIFCLPLYLIRFKIFNIPTTMLELLIYILFIFWLIQKGFNPPSSRPKSGLRTARGIIWPVVLILIGVTISTIFSWNLRTSAGIWKAWFIDPLLFFIVIVSVIKNTDQIKKIFYSLIFSGFIVSIVSLIYLILGKLDGQGRLQAFYTSPNYLAMYLAPILVISLGLVVFKKDYLSEDTRRCPSGTSRSIPACSRLRRQPMAGRSPSLGPTEVGPPCPFGLRMVFLISNLFLLLIILFFTKSFGAWLGVLGALIFWLTVYLFRTKNKKIILFFLALTLILIVILVYFKINSDQGRRSFNSRLEIWQKAWQVFRDYPVIGIGPGTFQDYFPAYPRWGVPQPHNLYLAFLLQTGIIGFIGFIWLLAWFFWMGFKIYNLKFTIFTIIVMSAMIYILVHGLVDTTYWKNDLSVMFWLIIGMMVVLKNPR